MKDWIIEKRLIELNQNGKTIAENNKELFKEYHQDMLNGVSQDESEARALLILINSSLSKYILLHKFGLSEDCEGQEESAVCKIGLIKAIDSFNLDKGVGFSTYAVKVIQNELLMYYRNLKRFSNTISIEDCMMENFRGEPKIQYSHNFSENADFVDDIAEMDEFECQYENFIHLNPLEQRVVIYTFGLFNNPKLKQREIAIKIDKSRTRVSRLLCSAMEKLKILAVDENMLSEEQIVIKNKILKDIYQLEPRENSKEVLYK